MKTTNTIKYGKIEVEKGTGTSPYMPANAGAFIDHGDILKTLAIAIKDNLPVLLIGESGTGKTSAIRHLAAETLNGLRRVNLNGGTTADELVGRLLINEKGTYWVDGILTEAMRAGEWIVLDEINAALPEVLFVLQSVMDDDGYLVLTEKADKEIVHKHPNFRIFATCNPPEYAGTKEMNKALLSRFAICISADYPPAKQELEIIKHHLGSAIAESELAIKLVGLANDTRKAKELGNADYAINTRDVLNTLRLSPQMDSIEALELAFTNKLDSADNKALKTMAKLYLPSTKKKSTARRAIGAIHELTIGNNYVMDADIHNTYFGLTDDMAQFKDLTKNSLGDVITTAAQENAVKGDEFVITGFYYDDNTNGGVSDTVMTGSTIDKAASAIQFVGGANKGKQAVIIHHPGLGNTANIINQIFELI